MHHQRRILLASLPAAVAVLLAGCGPDKDPAEGSAASGSSSPSASASSADNGVAALGPSAVLARARQASSAARSVRIRGRFSEEGQNFVIDMRTAGKRGARGRISMNGQRIALIRVGSAVYFRGDAAFWRAIGGQAAVRQLSGKYLKTTTHNKDFAEFSSFTVPSEFFAEVLKPDGSGPLKKGGREQVNGVPAITLVDVTGGKLYVATEGKPYVLRIDPGQGSQFIEFLDYDEPVKIKAPPAARVIDVDKLGGA